MEKGIGAQLEHMGSIGNSLFSRKRREKVKKLKKKKTLKWATIHV